MDLNFELPFKARKDILGEAIEKYFGQYDMRLALIDNVFLEAALSIVFSTYYNLLTIDSYSVLCGLPVLIMGNKMMLVAYYVDKHLCTLTKEGKYKEYSLENVVDRFKQIADKGGFEPFLITVKLFSSLGLINKEDVDSSYTGGHHIHIKNKIINYYVKWESLYD